MISKLDHYKVFVTVAQEKTISKAAKKLFVSQSAVSQSIAQMEKTLASKLFNRTSRGISLTDEGNILFEYALSALELLTSAEDKLEEMKTLTLGNLNIGASDTICNYLLLNPLEEFHKNYPKIGLKIVNRTSLDLIAMLKIGKLDIVFLNLPIEDKDLEILPLTDVQDTFVMAPHFHKKTHLTLEELSTLPLIMLEGNSNSRQYVDAFFHQHGIRLNPEIELGSYELLFRLTAIGLGVASVIKEFSSKEFQNEDLIELKIIPPIPPRKVGVASQKGVSLNRAATEFIEILRKNHNF